MDGEFDPRGRPLRGERQLFDDPLTLEQLTKWAGSADVVTPYSALLYDALRRIKELKNELARGGTTG